MKKKVLLFLLALSVSALALGCCKDDPASEDTFVADEPEVEEVVEEEPVTVKWVLRTDVQEDDPIVLEELNKLLKEKSNYSGHPM